MRLPKFALVVAAAMLAAACGGGSSAVTGGPSTGPDLGSPSSQTTTTTTVASSTGTAISPTTSAVGSPAPATRPAAHSAAPTPTHTTAKPTPKSTGPTACAANSKTASLTMENDATNPTEPYKFSSSSVSVTCGGSVKLTNNSATTHTFSPTGGGFNDSGDIGAGASKTVRFFYKGSYGFVCAYHSWMKGTVHVT